MSCHVTKSRRVCHVTSRRVMYFLLYPESWTSTKRDALMHTSIRRVRCRAAHLLGHTGFVIFNVLFDSNWTFLDLIMSLPFVINYFTRAFNSDRTLLWIQHIKSIISIISSCHRMFNLMLPVLRTLCYFHGPPGSLHK